MSDWKQVGSVAVDSGCMWLGDPRYVLHCESGDEPVDIGEDWQEFCDRLDKIMTSEIVAVPFRFNIGTDGLGVCVGGFGGDGTYPVEVLRGDNGIVKGVRIMFDKESDDGR